MQFTIWLSGVTSFVKFVEAPRYFDVGGVPKLGLTLRSKMERASLI